MNGACFRALCAAFLALIALNLVLMVAQWYA